MMQHPLGPRETQHAQVVQREPTDAKPQHNLPDELPLDRSTYIPPKRLEPTALIPIRRPDKPAYSGGAVTPRPGTALAQKPIEVGTSSLLGEARPKTLLATQRSPSPITRPCVARSVQTQEVAKGFLPRSLANVVRVVAQRLVPTTEAEKSAVIRKEP